MRVRRLRSETSEEDVSEGKISDIYFDNGSICLSKNGNDYAVRIQIYTPSVYGIGKQPNLRSINVNLEQYEVIKDLIKSSLSKDIQEFISELNSKFPDLFPLELEES